MVKYVLMQVPEYIGNFRKTNPEDDLQVGPTAVAFGPAGTMLDDMLRRIGVDDPRDKESELYMIAEEVAEHRPRVVEYSAAVCRELSIGSYSETRRDTMQVKKRDQQPQDSRSPEELEQGVRSSIEAVRFMITAATVQTLARLVLLQGKMSEEKAAIQAIGDTNPEFNAAFTVAGGGELVIERAFIGNTRVGQAQVDFRPARFRRAPDWIRSAKQWDDGPVDLAAGFHVEEDGLIIVREWCKSRKNGYIPILSSSGIDSGQHTSSRREANLQADVLLVSLGKEPDVLPVQMKNIVNEANRAEYDPRVILMSAQDMGGVEMRPDRVRDRRGDLHTGSVTKTVVGRITTNFSSVVNSRNNQKQQVQKFTKGLQPQVNRFDELVEQMRARTATPE